MIVDSSAECDTYATDYALTFHSVDRVISPCTCIYVEEMFAIEKVGMESCQLDSPESTERNYTISCFP